MSLNRSKFLEPNEDRVVLNLSLDSRDKILIALARATGGRATELLRLRPEDLYPNTNTVFIRGLKRSRDREIPLTPALFKALQDLANESSGGTIFGINYRRLEQVWKIHRPVDKKFHSLRHTFAIALYKKTKDLKLVQLALGHRSFSSTQVYLEFIYNSEEMRRILD